MKRYTALLRGINVGGNNKVSMPELKKAFEALGYKNVSTYINSGNVIFETAKGADAAVEEIEKALKKRFGFAVRVVMRSAANILKVSRAIPEAWANDAEVKTDILFLWDEFVKKSSLRLIDAHSGVDRLKYVDGAIIWSVERKHYAKSGMKKFIGTKLYKHMTARNVNTVRKLAEMMKAK